jgi:hypothetical protein
MKRGEAQIENVTGDASKRDEMHVFFAAGTRT